MDDYEILDIAMRNSYEVIVNEMDVEEIIIKDFGYLVHNPNLPLKLEEVEIMLEYFESIEEYEKCIELKKIISWIS